MPEFITGTASAAFLLLAQMAPYLFLGLFVAGILHVLLPLDFVSKQLGKNSIGSVFKAATLGVPLPLCSCGVVPVAASLKKNGASPGATVSFLVTTPTTGVDSILATYSLLGLPITLARLISSFVIGIFAGTATVLGTGRTEEAAPKKESLPVSSENNGNKFIGTINYAFGELLEGIAGPLALGCLLGGAIEYFVPMGLIEQYIGSGFVAYLVMLAVGIPLYVCASGSIPLAAALLAKGISPGAALIFLIAGPATNAATIAVISNVLGKKTLFIYLAVLVGGALGAGVVTDAVFINLMGTESIQQAAGHIHEEISIFETISAVILGLLMAWHLKTPLVARFNTMKAKHMKEVEVPDMTCAHCAGTIEGAVGPLKGIKSVHADPGTKKVHIDASDETVLAEAIAAIEEAGYHPKKPT